jgi:hypothetical protein
MFQVLVLQPDAYDFQFPPVYLGWLAKFQLVTFDLVRTLCIQ